MQSEKEQLKREVQQHFGLIKYAATLGDANGIVYDDPVNKPGMVRIRYTTAAGLSLPPVVRMSAVVPPNPGMAVWVGFDEEGQLAVLKPNFGGQIASGVNPLLNNPTDPNVYGKTNQTQLATLLCHANSTPNTPSLTVTVKALIYVQNGIWYAFPGKSDVDLSSFVPASGSQCLAGIYLKTDQTLEVFASTAIASVNPSDLGLADIQEIQALTTAGSIPVWFWRMYGGQTAVIDKDSYLDGRQFINIVETSAAATTDDSARFLAWRGYRS